MGRKSVTQCYKEEIITTYKQLFSQSETWRHSFTIKNQTIITDEEKSWLERPFQEQEVLQIIRLCANDKAPIPDG